MKSEGNIGLRKSENGILVKICENLKHIENSGSRRNNYLTNRYSLLSHQLFFILRKKYR